MSLSDDRQADIVDAFNTTSRCLGDAFGIKSVYFGTMVGRLCPSGLQLGGTNACGARAAFWTCVCQFLMILFLQEFVVGMATLILRLSISHFCVT